MDRFFSQILRDSPDAILIADRDGRIRFWNAGAERMFGYAAAEVLGDSLDLIIPANLRPRHWQGYFRVMETGATNYLTDMLASPGLRKDGSRLSLEFSIVLLRDEQGAMAGCAAILRDVSERWHKEKELKQRLAACEGKLQGGPA
ncbi:MAG: PAS domain S-box protein [Desulfobulbus sp.]|jgi:PAS domain S-box-containing protein|uniref:PAS domain-containing protein n=1 Tax=Desulfobulbus sp. TaxID=895 RepID=UPI002843CC96|nr:PAS domain S-box protein [Desulfobulbus sp.]MDR2549028.1 PAS domain S-box protein [Desulfobulbus sp.]